MLTAFLRRHPDAVTARPDGSLALTRERLAESLTAYRAGDRKAAAELALSAYLDGFEPVEPVLSARDAARMARIETGMAQLRAAIGQGRPTAEVEAANRSLANLFAEAEAALAPERASGASSFLGAFGVLLREGLEALIVVAMIAFLKKTDRPDVLGYVHGGWAVALAAGVATWFAATYFITVSGASRNLPRASVPSSLQ
jgi:high-affinity iron transporter